MKRKITIGNYDTAANGWTLSRWKLSAAEQKTNYKEKLNGDGSWDLSTALTDGIIKYKNRTFTATLECSEGDRLSRETKIRQMINQLDGMVEDIELPDDEFHYITGRLRVVKEYNDTAHASVTVTATCDPWKYANNASIVTLSAKTAEQIAQLVNNGRRAIVPVLDVSGDGASVRIIYGAEAVTISEGSYRWPALLLTPGSHKISYTGKGVLTITYREAVLE